MDTQNNEIIQILDKLKKKTIYLEKENQHLKDENTSLTQHLDELEETTTKKGNKFLVLLYITLLLIIVIQVFILLFF